MFYKVLGLNRYIDFTALAKICVGYRKRKWEFDYVGEKIEEGGECLIMWQRERGRERENACVTMYVWCLRAVSKISECFRITIQAFWLL